MLDPITPLLHYSITPILHRPITPFRPPLRCGGPAGIPTAENGTEVAINGEANDFTLPMNRNATTNRFLAYTSRPHHTEGVGNLRDFHALDTLLPAAGLNFGQASPRFVGSAVSTGPRRRCEPREGA